MKVRDLDGLAATDTRLDVDALSPADLDRLDQGVIALDAEGRVRSFNESASSMSGLSPDSVIGQHYFRDVAPSTNVPGFHGRFLDGVRRGRLDEQFGFVFASGTHQLRTVIGLRKARKPKRWWLIITPLEQVGAGRSREAVLAAVGRRVRAEPVDPRLCEREPIHIPGAIQPNAVLIAADAATSAIVAYSANVHDLVPDDGTPLDGRPLDGLIPAAFFARIRSGIDAGTLGDGQIVGATIRMPDGAGTRAHALAHLRDERIIVELERLSEHPADFAAASPLDVETALRRLRASRTIDEAGRIVAEDIRALTGFESVLVYRFDAEWNGAAIAEDMAAGWNRPLIGLHFPASDIPAQARALYTRSKSRFVIDRDAVPVPLMAAPAAGNAPLDLSLAQSRTLSPIHLEYQRNLGVNGSMSISILVEDKLWGLMIGHHRRPHYVAPETRAAAVVLTDAFAMHIQEIEARRLWLEQQAHLATESRLVRALTRSDSVVQALSAGSTTLLDLFGVTGAAIVSDGPVTLIGRCPGEAQVLALAAWLRTELPPEKLSFTTIALGSAYPPAGAYQDVASGLLASFVDPSRSHLLLWFRPEVPSTVTWGGDPRKPVVAGSGAVAVLPRRSFERWVEERSGFAEPFADWQVSLAEQLAEAVEGVVLRQRRKIDELTELLADKERLLAQKDLLTKEIDHRVKNSLQIISAFLQMQRRQTADPAAREAFADTSARVMSIARVHDSLYQADAPLEVDLGQTIAALCNDLAGMAGDRYGIDLSAEPALMVPYRKAVALSLIATELVTNAFKYAAKPGGGARVKVSVAADKGAIRMRICDDGEGLPEGWQQDKPRGTGLGMKLIRAMLDQIDARMDTRNDPGACFTVHA